MLRLPVDNQVNNLQQEELVNLDADSGNPVANQPDNPTQRVLGKLASILYSELYITDGNLRLNLALNTSLLLKTHVHRGINIV